MRIIFEDSSHPPIELSEGTPLADALDGPHSPVFFGCKEGNCGTCLIEVDAEGYDRLPPPNESERDMVEALAPDKPRVRLACLLRPHCDLKIRYAN